MRLLQKPRDVNQRVQVSNPCGPTNNNNDLAQSLRSRHVLHHWRSAGRCRGDYADCGHALPGVRTRSRHG
jgi:hypothetical protein